MWLNSSHVLFDENRFTEETSNMDGVFGQMEVLKKKVQALDKANKKDVGLWKFSIVLFILILVVVVMK